MWTYTAAVVEARRDPEAGEFGFFCYAINGDDGKQAVIEELFEEEFRKTPQEEGFYYMEWGYGSGQGPVVYKIEKIGPLLPSYYEDPNNMPQFHNTDLAGDMF